jgi:hypothetical protein
MPQLKQQAASAEVDIFGLGLFSADSLAGSTPESFAANDKGGEIPARRPFEPPPPVVVFKDKKSGVELRLKRPAVPVLAQDDWWTSRRTSWLGREICSLDFEVAQRVGELMNYGGEVTDALGLEGSPGFFVTVCGERLVRCFPLEMRESLTDRANALIERIDAQYRSFLEEQRRTENLLDRMALMFGHAPFELRKNDRDSLVENSLNEILRHRKTLEVDCRVDVSLYELNNISRRHFKKHREASEANDRYWRRKHYGALEEDEKDPAVDLDALRLELESTWSCRPVVEWLMKTYGGEVGRQKGYQAAAKNLTRYLRIDRDVKTMANRVIFSPYYGGYSSKNYSDAIRDLNIVLEEKGVEDRIKEPYRISDNDKYELGPLTIKTFVNTCRWEVSWEFGDWIREFVGTYSGITFDEPDGVDDDE